MVVSEGGAPKGTGREPVPPAGAGPAQDAPRGLPRRLLAPALALGLAPVVAASRPSGPAAPSRRERYAPDPVRAAARPVGGPETAAFDETYRGRRVRGVRSADGTGAGGAWHVTVDGRPLHLMPRADGTWLSVVDHSRSYPTPLEAARAAVDELPPGQHLRAPSGGHGHGHGQDHGRGNSGGDRHGVHA